MDETVNPQLWGSLITVTGIWFITVVSPGPNFLATAHSAAAQSRGAGVLVAAGISLGTTIWATASLFGLGLLFQTAGWLYYLVKVAGAAYLIFVGLRLLLSARRQTLSPAPAPRVLTSWQAFRRGLLTDLSNPKAAAFFTSLFAVAVPPLAPLWFQITIVTAVVVIAGGWYALVACFMARGSVAAAYRRAQRFITALTGAIFVGFGLRLAVDR